MNKILTIITLTFACVCFADDSVMVDNNGTLTYPDKATFAKKNAVNLSVFVDLYRDGLDDVSGMRLTDGGKSIYWSDCELKVLDKDGNIIYFFSTIYFNSKQVQALHDSKYNDTDATVYYYVSGGNTNGVCVKPKKKLTNFNSSIGAIENAYNGNSNAGDGKVRITAIQIYPSEKFRDVFLNPENSIMVWRQSIYSAETDGNGDKVWRPAIIQFIR